jgi:hypothetical protein
MTMLLVFRRFVRETDLRAERKTSRACPVIHAMLRPVREAGKALSMPRCSVFAAFLAGKTAQIRHLPGNKPP